MSPKTFSEYQQEKQLQTLNRQIFDDSDECKDVAILESSLAKMYSIAYPAINAQFVTLTELQKMADLGRFKTYVLASIDLPTETEQFLETYYEEIGKSSRVALYALIRGGDAEGRRYIWKDLRKNTGHHRKDSQSTSGIVTLASPKDRAGYLSFAPQYPVCRSGHYVARFAIRASGAQPDEAIVSLKVNADSYDMLVRRYLRGEDFPDPEKYYTFDLPFDLDVEENQAFPMKRLQFLVKVAGNATVRLDYIELRGSANISCRKEGGEILSKK